MWAKFRKWLDDAGDYFFRNLRDKFERNMRNKKEADQKLKDGFSRCKLIKYSLLRQLKEELS
jgi:hypothetical protein